MPSALIERSFVGILVVVGCLVVALVALRIVTGVARRRAAQRTDALLKKTLETAASPAPDRDSPAAAKADRERSN